MEEADVVTDGEQRRDAFYSSLADEQKGFGRRELLMVGGSGLGVAVLAFIITVFATGGITGGTPGPDRIAFHYADATSEQLPLNAELAATVGWSGSVRCILGSGRFYQKPGSDGPYPVMVMYGPEPESDLIGIQVHSLVEQPARIWDHQPEGLENTTVDNMGFDHWSLGLYIINPTKACGGYKGGRDRGGIT